jgi:hypothetical protein
VSAEADRPELNALALALGRLAPVAPAIDRDRLFYRAGQESQARSGRWWRRATGALALGVAALGGALALRPMPEPVERVVYLRVEVPTPTTAQAYNSATVPERATAGGEESERRLSPWNSWQLERLVLRWGVDGLPGSGPAWEPYRAAGRSGDVLEGEGRRRLAIP